MVFVRLAQWANLQQQAVFLTVSGIFLPRTENPFVLSLSKHEREQPRNCNFVSLGSPGDDVEAYIVNQRLTCAAH
jgi:hypothetical protein